MARFPEAEKCLLIKMICMNLLSFCVILSREGENQSSVHGG